MSDSTADQQPIDEIASIPAPVTAIDRLQTLYRSPGPYTSVFLATLPLLPDAGDDLQDRWQVTRRDLEVEGAPEAALKAIDARLTLPSPEDTAGLAVIAASDGTTVVDHGLEPPRFDFGRVGVLPYAAPLIEWQQNRMAHLVVTVDETGGDIATFGLDHYTRLDSYSGDEAMLVDRVTKTAEAIFAELIVLSGSEAQLQRMADVLATSLPAECRVVLEPDIDNADDLAAATVRHLSDAMARSIVGRLRDQRFLATHDAAVEGAAETVSALAAGTATEVLVHDDPDDERTIWVGSQPTELSLDMTGDYAQTRLVDGLIRSAVLQGVPVYIIPSTGPAGPDDDTAAVTE